eukprot:TRINITY_DN7281_c1_g3_i1.p1 TRINITY_DN7281_c1_g3~~TRINITY_DN7281_c1_g3_i1.p1  ORF type:complete len:375 (-),score=127.53 TRINITY_DN7281_c1_g3_i1:857-1981(-)
MALEIIGQSDALYHNAEHTILVTLVGQEILRGKHLKEGGVSPEDWLHFVISLLCHDIGYVKGVCLKDRPKEHLFDSGRDGVMIKIAPGATDAALTPYHVDRGKTFVRERFKDHGLIHADLICANIELTRFPVPSDSDHQGTDNYAGLVRAADLIGQLSDPRYHCKIPALFYEFQETGASEKLGYKHPGDLRRKYPSFYWNVVHRFISKATSYLENTHDGHQILANLRSNIFVVEHEVEGLKGSPLPESPTKEMKEEKEEEEKKDGVSETQEEKQEEWKRRSKKKNPGKDRQFKRREIISEAVSGDVEGGEKKEIVDDAIGGKEQVTPSGRKNGRKKWKKRRREGLREEEDKPKPVSIDSVGDGGVAEDVIPEKE